jgi:hypothetical protein
MGLVCLIFVTVEDTVLLTAFIILIPFSYRRLVELFYRLESATLTAFKAIGLLLLL